MTCGKIKTWNAQAYEWVGLWNWEIQITKVKNQFKLLCTKKLGITFSTGQVTFSHP